MAEGNPVGRVIEALGNGNVKVNGIYRLGVALVSTLATLLTSVCVWLFLEVWNDVRDSRDTAHWDAAAIINEQDQINDLKHVTVKQTDVLEALAERLSRLEGEIHRGHP